jgi:hypothetical protein
MQRVRIVAMASIVSIALAACGGSSGDDELSKADYKKQTDEACAAFQKKLTDTLKGFDANDASSLDTVAKNAADLLHQVADDLREVGHPEGLSDEATKFYDGLDKAADKLADDPEVLGSNETPKEFQDLDALADKLDITNCGAT